MVSDELGTMFEHLLKPMGVPHRPRDLSQAVQAYADARDSQEHRYGVFVTRTLEREVRKPLERP
jgi:hypothetical protein